MKTVNYSVVDDQPGFLVIRDIGPWEMHLSVTNGAEIVVAELLSRLNGRKLYYYDTEGNLDQLVIKGGKFNGYCSGGPYVKIVASRSVTGLSPKRDDDALYNHFRKSNPDWEHD